MAHTSRPTGQSGPGRLSCSDLPQDGDREREDKLVSREGNASVVKQVREMKRSWKRNAEDPRGRA